MTTPKVPGYRVKRAVICNVREGDLVLSEGSAVEVRATTINNTGSGYVYALIAGDESTIHRGPGNLPVYVLKANPEVGDGATQHVGSDSYPLTVIAVSKSAHEITVQRDNYRHVSGDGYYADNNVYEYTPNPDGAVLKARWSAKYGRYQTSGGTPISVGHRRYRNDPSF